MWLIKSEEETDSNHSIFHLKFSLRIFLFLKLRQILVRCGKVVN